MKTYFGFALADSMFPATCEMIRHPLSVQSVDWLLRDGPVEFCLNPSHVPTIEAARSRFGLEIQVPEVAPNVTLERGDSLILMSVRGLPRLGADRKEYTTEEISSATFSFGIWTVQ